MLPVGYHLRTCYLRLRALAGRACLFLASCFLALAHRIQEAP